MGFFCKIGLHDWKFEDKWTPSIYAKFVERFEKWGFCDCGKMEKVCDTKLVLPREDRDMI